MNALRIHRGSPTFVAGVLFLIGCGIAGGAELEPTDSHGAFLQKYCLECHGPDATGGILRLDRLKEQFDGAAASASWVKVFDKVSLSRMPPSDAEQPSPEERSDFTKRLQRQLHEASLARQRREGRVMLRRLNRAEYAATLADLLGTSLRVDDLLPEDNEIAGFDKVSKGLDISPAHLLRYQEAAERACLSVIPDRPPKPFEERRSGREITERISTFRDALGKTACVVDGALLLHARLYGHIPCATAAVRQAGRYRVRGSLQAVGTEGRALPVMCSCRERFGRDDDDVRAVFDAPADKPFLLEGEFDLKAGEMIVFTPWSLPDTRSFLARSPSVKLDEYEGPGLKVDWLEISGPIDPWPPVKYQLLFADLLLKARSVALAEARGLPPPNVEQRSPEAWGDDPLIVVSGNPHDHAETLLRSFLQRAFRRPVEEKVARYYIDLVDDALKRGETFTNAMILGYKAVLCSPNFLFLLDAPASNDVAESFDDYARAARLSYFLWCSAPDEELLQLAKEGKLTSPDVLRDQVERMLNHPRSQRFVRNFVDQWLDLRRLRATSPDPRFYGEFDDYLEWSMPQETLLFFAEMLRHDRRLTEFIDSDWTFLNERLARHYGIHGVDGAAFRPVVLPPESHRGGVLTQASVLKVTADGTKTSPVLRGKWVLERILGQPPDPPPPNIPAVESDIRGAVTIREQLAKHRDSASCAACHRHIDPPGFALEAFDPIGGLREHYRTIPSAHSRQVTLENYPERKAWIGPKVDASGETADGRKFQSIDDYKQLLLADKDQLARNLARHLLVYATGAEIQFADREVVEQLVADCREHDYGLRSLIHAVVQSRVFLNK